MRLTTTFSLASRIAIRIFEKPRPRFQSDMCTSASANYHDICRIAIANRLSPRPPPPPAGEKAVYFIKLHAPLTFLLDSRHDFLHARRGGIEHVHGSAGPCNIVPVQLNTRIKWVSLI